MHKIESIDEANWGYNYSLVGGSDVSDTVEKITFESKLVAGPNGGSIAKITVSFHTKGDANPSEEEINAIKARGQGLFKAFEGYVLTS